MTITAPTTGLQGLATGTAGAAASKTSADLNMFLKMLTTQMQNQDPLSPMDTTQYTQQLVQYSQVEQSIQQNGTLKDILSHLTTQNMAQASGFIGREAQFNSAIAGLAGGAPAQWGYTADRPVASLVATISDATGKVVETRPLDPTDAPGRLAWDGALATGGKAADGSYTLAVKGLDASGGTVKVAISSIGTVKEVVTADGAVSLSANGVAFPATQLLRLSQTAD